MTSYSVSRLFLISCLSLFFLAGCTNPFVKQTKELTPNLPTQSYQLTIDNLTEFNSQQTNVEPCDKYLDVIRCIANAQSGTELKNNYIKSHNDMLLSRKDIPVEQLTNLCNTINKNLLANPKILLETNCKL